MIRLNNAVEVQHYFWLSQLPNSRLVIDATCGNGHDTLFLAEHMPLEGHLIALDLQAEAIKNCQLHIKKNLERNDLKKLNIEYIQGNHTEINNYVSATKEKFADLVIFNLGYLPKGDHKIMTKSETTIRAVKTTLSILNDKGLITLVAYPGTAAGKLEQEELERYISSLDQHKYDISQWKPINQINNPPILYLIKAR